MPLREGAKIFASTCSGCHGLDGRGSERAPDIAQRREVQRLTDAELLRIVQEGVAGTGMPAFHALRDTELKSVVAYLRVLQGSNKPVILPGDPKRGELTFMKAGCAECHTVAGNGGFLASDLSTYAHTHSAGEIRDVVIHPSQEPGARAVVVTVRDGQKYSGRIRNEDNFSLQLQTADGKFHFLAKSEIEQMEYDPQSLMPADYSSKLSAKELDDIVSYLMKSASLRKPENRAENDD
jgi:cytochrome c oxidase cbb3-type subunit III